MKIWPNLTQGSDEWFAVRAGRPTASEFSRIFTAGGKDSSQWESYAMDLVCETLRRGEPPEWSGNRDTDRGTELEPEARAMFAEWSGLDVREVGFVTRDDELVGCSPDGLIYEGETPFSGVEIKCPRVKGHAEALVAGVMPSQHRPQVHGAMAVTGLNHWWFVSYCRGLRPLILRVERDDYTDRLADALDRFAIYYASRRSELLPVLAGLNEPVVPSRNDGGHSEAPDSPNHP